MCDFISGRINLDLNPSDYMEMYSYGVYLIDILQVIFTSNLVFCFTCATSLIFY